MAPPSVSVRDGVAMAVPGLNGRVLLKSALFMCGTLAVQRFALGTPSSLVCAIPLLLAIYAALTRHASAAATCLLLSLVFSVDNGGGVYPETPAAIRYVIYVGVFLSLLLFSTGRVRVRLLLAGCVLLGGIFVGTLCNVLDGGAVFDTVTLRRDFIVLVVLLPFLLARSERELDLGLLYSGGLGYLFGEVFNILFFYHLDTDYLSYDSLKAFVVFPVLYALLREQGRLWQLFLVACTMLVVFLYGSRMITLSALLLVMLVPLVKSVRTGTVGIYAGFAALAVLAIQVDIVSILGTDALAQFKALSFFLVLIQNFDASDLLAMFSALDPVRFGEHQLFFARPLQEILFGSGLGSGIADVHGVLGFVGYEQTAFSAEELRTSTYFNLHDFWIDYGLRFGLLPVLLLIFGLSLREMWRGRYWQGVLFGVLLLNTTFATSGLLLTAMLVRGFPRNQPQT